MSSLEPKLAKGRECRLQAGSGDMLERVKDCKIEENERFGRGTETCSREKAGMENALASIRY